MERFTLSSNNVTYALNGETLGYWSAFPSAEPGWGRVPAWGVARVVDGDPELAEPGQVFVGFLPMATHVLVPAQLRGSSLRATAPERAGMHTLYRDLTRVEVEPDDVTLAVLPGVPSAAHLDEEVRRTGPRQVVFSSATSRTALTTAVLLRRAGVRVVGLTAATRAEAADRARVYDQVIPYDSSAGPEPSDASVYVDVAGRAEITARVHHALGDALTRSLRVGGTHAATTDVRDSRAGTPVTGSVAAPPVEQFNVGQRRVERAAQLGEEATADFERQATAPIIEWAAGHLSVERVHGLERAREAWTRTWRGEREPLTAMMVTPGP